MHAKRCAVVALLSCVAMIAAPLANAESKLVRPVVKDVALHESGLFFGQVLDAQGVGMAGKTVSLRQTGQGVIQTRTDEKGQFRVAGLKGGVYQVTACGNQDVCRLWAPKTAPPAAQRGLLVVSRTDVVRGQCGCGTPVCGTACGSGCDPYGRGGCGGIGGWMANHPLITAGAIATAIAVPLAVDDDDDDPPATP